MTEQPYRSPAKADAPPDRVVTLGLRRYPLAAQIFFLAWFPVVSLVTAALVPTEAITCARAIEGKRPACRLERESLIRNERIQINDTRTAVHVDVVDEKHAKLVIEPLHVPEKPEVITTNLADGEAIAQSYRQFFDSRERGIYHRSIHRLSWLYLVLAAIECAIGAFFVITQRKIFLDNNKDTGVVHIERGGRFGPILEDDLALADVKSFSVEELESTIQRRRVSATMLDGETKVLFDATLAEAKRGAKFLEEAHAEWNAREVAG